MYLLIPIDEPPVSIEIDIPTEIDLIEAIIGYANLTHAWNQLAYELRWLRGFTPYDNRTLYF